MAPRRIVISPGPCTPERGGHLGRRSSAPWRGSMPILGVCLGHQCIGAAFGGRIVRAERLMHGKTSPIEHDGRTIFAGLPNPFDATRYHSLVIDARRLPECLEVERPDRRKARSWACATATFVSRGCSSIRSRSSPCTAKQLLENFLGARSLRRARSAARGRDDMDIQQAIAQTAWRGRDLSAAEMEEVVAVIMAGEATPAQIGGFLVALRIKGESVGRDRRRGARDAPLRRAVAGDATTSSTPAAPAATPARHLQHLDRGGADRGRGGLRVAKHGNRAMSGKVGGADVLEALGVRIELSRRARRRPASTRSASVFLFAPVFHPAMRHVAPVRRELGIRTIFNLLGPLTNPAGARAPGGRRVQRRVARAHGAGARPARHANAPWSCTATTVSTRSRSAARRASPSCATARCAPTRWIRVDLGLELCRPAELRGGDVAANAALVRAHRRRTGQRGAG